MKKIILSLLVAVSGSTFAQRVVIHDIEKLAPFMKGEYSDKLISPNAEPEESSIKYEFYGFAEKAYQQKMNQLIYDYTKTVAIDTAYIPIANKVSRQFFKDAVHNFFEGYNYLRFQLNVDDLPPFWFKSSIRIDTTSLKNYVQLLAESSIFTGGAHPYLINQYHLVDKKSGNELFWKELLKDSVSFAKLAETYFRKEEKLKPTDSYESYFFENQQYALSQQFIFSKKGITLVYLPYEVREWARGTISVFIPKKKIKKYLTINW